MPGAPVYVSQQAPIAPEPIGVKPVAIPELPNEIAPAVAQFGEAVTDFAVKLHHAQQETKENQARADYLVGLDKLREQYGKDPDYQAAPQKFSDERQKLESDILGRDGLDQRSQERLRLDMVHAGISANRHVTQAAWTREAQANVAANDTERIAALQQGAQAGSPVERDGVVETYRASTARLAAAGWISAPEAVARVQRLHMDLDGAGAMATIRTDPVRAQALLEDPKNFPSLDPTSRETFKNQAANGADQLRIDQAGKLAETDPAAARKFIEDSPLQPHNKFRGLQAIDTVVRQQEATARHAASVAAATDRSSDPIIDVIKQGGDVDPVRVQSALALNDAAAVRGDQAAAKYAADLREQIALQPFVRQAWSLAPQELDTAVNRMRAELTAQGGNPTIEQFRALHAFDAVAKEQQQKRNSEPVLLGSAAGARFYKITPVDVAKAAAGDTAAAAALVQRGAHALAANAQFGGNGSPFTAEELKTEKARWEQAGGFERFQTLQALAKTLPPTIYRGAVSAIAGDEFASPLFERLLTDRPDVAQTVLRGMAILGEKNVGEKSQLVRGELQRIVGGQIYPTSDQQEQAVRAAMALDAARRADRGALYDANDVSGLQKAWEDVAGPIVKINGARTPVTPGIPAHVFTSALAHLDATDIARSGGARDRSGRELTAGQLSSYAVLKPMEPGSRFYLVGAKDPRASDGFAPYLNVGGAPLVFDMREIAANHLRQAPAGPTFGSAFRAAQERIIRAEQERTTRGGP